MSGYVQELRCVVRVAKRDNRASLTDVNDPIMRFMVDVTSGTTFRDVIDVLQSYVHCKTYMVLVNVQFLYWSVEAC